MVKKNKNIHNIFKRTQAVGKKKKIISKIKQNKATFWHFSNIIAAAHMNKQLMLHTKTDFWLQNLLAFSPKILESSKNANTNTHLSSR